MEKIEKMKDYSPLFGFKLKKGDKWRKENWEEKFLYKSNKINPFSIVKDLLYKEYSPINSPLYFSFPSHLQMISF